MQAPNKETQIPDILAQLREKKFSIVNPRRKNGLILYKPYHAEFVGPGAVVGSEIDTDVVKVISVGNLSLVTPQTAKEKINAYLIRRQWVRLTKQITDNPTALQRAQVILNQFENWFDPQTTAQLPDEAFALLVGVLPQTIRKVRNAYIG
ncbi:MAG: hypothetical protein IGR93_07470 [Hydrococcus sp. C42_A2020_068]|uniref:hypothetical protein n=1 Tax=Pleurocapsa sp. PCC 7327 TaxID=118163 RepID=UPI00029FC389|nr:hypothetical protein [Pleurocapsa sp. PCC 7327]AFY79262.1 hypothetical protein Ple7327_4131 [Pleurocapsa sp. PCC 7327]MBF2019931.1 hypothetical protein [Hydrococcus sp. C42_A2020_068]